MRLPLLDMAWVTPADDGVGVTRTVSQPFARDAWSYDDHATHSWVVETGLFDVLVGASSADIRAQATAPLTS